MRSLALEVDAISLGKSLKKVSFYQFFWILKYFEELRYGADRRIRTADLTLTKGVLYRTEPYQQIGI